MLLLIAISEYYFILTTKYTIKFTVSTGVKHTLTAVHTCNWVQICLTIGS